MRDWGTTNSEFNHTSNNRATERLSRVTKKESQIAIAISFCEGETMDFEKGKLDFGYFQVAIAMRYIPK